MLNHRFVIAMILAALLAVPLVAQVRIKEYVRYKHSSDPVAREGFRLHLEGLGEGMIWSNAFLVAGSPRRRPLFCQPAKLVLNVDNYEQAIDVEIDRARARAEERGKDQFEDQPIGAVLLRGLIATFPCPVGSPPKEPVTPSVLPSARF